MESNGFYQMTKWLPTHTVAGKKKEKCVMLDRDFSGWIEHLKSIGFREGSDFQLRQNGKGQQALFRRGKDPFSRGHENDFEA